MDRDESTTPKTWPVLGHVSVMCPFTGGAGTQHTAPESEGHNNPADTDK